MQEVEDVHGWLVGWMSMSIIGRKEKTRRSVEAAERSTVSRGPNGAFLRRARHTKPIVWYLLTDWLTD